MLNPPGIVTYSSVVLRETIRIALAITALNELEVKVNDVMNAYLTAPCEEKVWTTLRMEFGVNAGKNALIVRTLYGLKPSGACSRDILQIVCGC
jgi:hypothetical protein